MTTTFLPTASQTVSSFDRCPVPVTPERHTQTTGILKRFLTALMRSLAVAHV